ncbi:MAG: taurine ABC transporter permease [Spirochaetaceae bacterium]|nr:MAG: taurine ABC transporter permease [Spirochaetaceae bacterium]
MSKKGDTMKKLLMILAALLIAPQAFTQTTNIRFTLDWAIQGPQAMFLVAQDRGYFAEEGLNVTIDRGYGSAGTVSQIAGGAYDIGFADINSMIEFNVQNPNQALQSIAVIYNYPPFAILTTRDRNIRRPQDLVGKRIGAPNFDSSYRLWPVFAKAVGIDPDSVTWVNMDPTLREPTLMRRQVDAIGAFYFTAALNLEAAGVNMNDIVSFLYAENGVDVYGNAIMAPRAFLERNPEAVRGMMRALTKAWHYTLANPESAIESVRRADGLTDSAVELARLQLAIETNIMTPEVHEVGFGGVDKARLENSIDQIVEAFGLPSTPSVDSIFTDAYLPPLRERLPR